MNGPTLTTAQRRKSFQRQLENALTYGAGGVTDEGLNSEVLYKINAVAHAFPNPSDEVVQAAKEAFENQVTKPIDWGALEERYSAR